MNGKLYRYSLCLIKALLFITIIATACTKVIVIRDCSSNKDITESHPVFQWDTPDSYVVIHDDSIDVYYPYELDEEIGMFYYINGRSHDWWAYLNDTLRYAGIQDYRDELERGMIPTDCLADTLYDKVLLVYYGEEKFVILASSWQYWAKNHYGYDYNEEEK